MQGTTYLVCCTIDRTTWQQDSNDSFPNRNLNTCSVLTKQQGGRGRQYTDDTEKSYRKISVLSSIGPSLYTCLGTGQWPALGQMSRELTLLLIRGKSASVLQRSDQPDIEVVKRMPS